MRLLQWETYLNAGTGSRLAGDINAGLVQKHRVLDNGEPQTGAADFLGAALVYPVEALKDPVSILFWNADACIPDGQDNRRILTGNRYGDVSAGLIVLDGIVCKIIHNAPQQLRYAPQLDVFSLQAQDYILFACEMLQAAGDLAGDLVQVCGFPLVAVSFIQTGEIDDILYPASEALSSRKWIAEAFSVHGRHWR